MRTIFAITLFIALSVAQYGEAAPAPIKAAPVPAPAQYGGAAPTPIKAAPVPAPAQYGGAAPAPVQTTPGACALPKGGSDAECTQQAQDGCSGGVTTTFAICRKVVFGLCKKPVAFADVAACVKNQCGSLQGDNAHPTTMVREVCSGTYDVTKIPDSQSKYFPRGIPTIIDGITNFCKRVVCAKEAAPVAPVTPEVVDAAPEVPAAAGLVDAYIAQQAKAAPVPLPPIKEEPKVEAKPVEVKPEVKYEAPAVDKDAKVEAKKEEAKKEEPKKEEAKKEEPKAQPPKIEVINEVPVVKIVDVPCDHATPDTDLPRVIYIAAEEEDCTSALKAEVTELELLVDKLTVLLTLKGVKVGTGEECAVPGVKKTDDKKDDNGKNGDDNTPKTGGDKNGDDKTPKTGDEKNGDGKTPKDDKKDDKDNKGGVKTGEDHKDDGKNPGKEGDKKEGDKKNDDKNDDKKNEGGNGGNQGHENGEHPETGGTGKNPSSRLATNGSSAAVNTMLTVGLVIAAAVGAGIAAVVIGLFVSAAAASAPAAASAAPMAACAVNPLYTPLANGGTNALH